MTVEPNNSGPGSALVLTDISLALPDRMIMQGFSLTVAPGEVATVMGPSGCGKSTLLSAIAGTLSPSFVLGGAISLLGRDLTTLPTEERRVGMLFQDALLFPHLNLGENLAFGVPAGLTRTERRERVDAALDRAGLAGMWDRDPDTLSGGQRARAALMRTLLSEPAALLLDEPFSRLDAALQERFRDFVFGHVTERQLPTLLVTHDPRDAEAAPGPVIAFEDFAGA